MKTLTETRTRWIPIYHTLFEHELVLRMRGMLKVPRLHVVGMVARTYAWLADRVSDSNRDQNDAVIAVEDPAFVFDDLVDHPGFFAAMCRVEWFVWDEANGTMRVRNYFEKNGTLALKRAADQSRQVKQRRRGEEPRTSADQESGSIRLDQLETKEVSKPVTSGRRKCDETVTETGLERDVPVRGAVQDRDQQKHEQEQKKTIHTASSDALVSQEAAKLAGWLAENLGITRRIAGQLVGEYPGPVLLTAGKMALIAKQQGWEGNQAGYVINRLKDGSAAAAVQSKQLSDDEIAAREWARRFLADDAAAQQVVFDAMVARNPSFERVGRKAVLSVLPAEAMLALAALLAERVERGEMNGRDVAPAFSAYVTRIGGGA